MPHRGPAAVPIVLSDVERAELVRRAGLPGRWRADRARIILACAEGTSNAGAAQALGVAVKSVSKWRQERDPRFATERRQDADLDGRAKGGRTRPGKFHEEPPISNHAGRPPLRVPLSRRVGHRNGDRAAA
jgi:hypothetical protein